MGSCTRRHFLLSICVLQMLFVIERQVFDFLGYMWAPILVNFFQILFVIFGFFGAYQYRPRYLVAYTVWSLLWLGWNIFLICFYLNIGILDRDSDLLNLGTGSVSWFEENGYGCRPTYPTNITSEDPYRPVRPERVDGCLLEYHIVEVVQSGIHCALAVFGIFGAICLGQTFLDEDDSFDFMGGDAKSPQHTAVHPMYVSYSSLPTTNSANSTQLKQAASSAKLLLLATSNGGIEGGKEDGGDGNNTTTTGGVVVAFGRPPNHTNGQCKHHPSVSSSSSLPAHHHHPVPQLPPTAGSALTRNNTVGGSSGGAGGGSFGDMLKAKLSRQHGPATGSSNGHHSPSNTNTLLSSSSSPSSTFTNLHSSPQSLHNGSHGSGYHHNNNHQQQHHQHHHNIHHQNSTGSQPAGGNLLTKLSSSNSINSGGSRVILLQHQDSSESSPPPTVPARGLSRNASFSKATTAGAGRDHHHAAALLNNNPLRKNNSGSVSILRYGEGGGVQGRRTPDPEDDTFFIPRSASSYQARAANFGISNPFNNVVLGRPAGAYRGAVPGADGAMVAGDDDGRRLLLLSGSAQQLGSSTPQKRNSLVGSGVVVGSNGGGTGSAGPTTPGSWNGRGSPIPQVPPLPQHYQRKGSDAGSSASCSSNAYLTRSPNLNRIARRHNGNGGNAGGTNGLNNNGHAGGGLLERGGRSGSSGRLPSTATQCDQIREYGAAVPTGAKPLGYCGAAVPSSPPENNNAFPPLPIFQRNNSGGSSGNGSPSGIPVMVMHRAKSQDRLAYRARRPGRTFGANGAGHHHHHHQQQQRPRSFCSNNGAYPDYVILEHPGN